jgi:hypothetical protein
MHGAQSVSDRLAVTTLDSAHCKLLTQYVPIGNNLVNTSSAHFEPVVRSIALRHLQTATHGYTL